MADIFLHVQAQQVEDADIHFFGRIPISRRSSTKGEGHLTVVHSKVDGIFQIAPGLGNIGNRFIDFPEKCRFFRGIPDSGCQLAADQLILADAVLV